MYKDKEMASFLVNLKNGSTGIYDVSRDAGQLQQTLRSGNKTVNYFTKKSPNNGVDVFSKKAGDYVIFPQTQSLSFVIDNGKITFASNYKRIPVQPKQYRDPISGQIKTKVSSTQELHQDKFVSSGVLPTDTLFGANGQYLPIFHRPMKIGESSVNVWKL